MTKPNHCIWPIRTHYTFVSTNDCICRIVTAAAWHSGLQLLPSYIWSLETAELQMTTNNNLQGFLQNRWVLHVKMWAKNCLFSANFWTTSRRSGDCDKTWECRHKPHPWEKSPRTALETIHFSAKLTFKIKLASVCYFWQLWNSSLKKLNIFFKIFSALTHLDCYWNLFLKICWCFYVSCRETTCSCIRYDPETWKSKSNGFDKNSKVV